MGNLTDKALADKLSFARSMGASSAWAELLRRFDYKQRQHLANLLAHHWTIKQIVLEPYTGSSQDLLDANISLENVKFPSKQEQDPKIDELVDNEKTIAALMADNNKLRIQANSCAADLQSIQAEIHLLLTILENFITGENSEKPDVLKKITEFKEMYLNT